jgi:hypothetical protein
VEAPTTTQIRAWSKLDFDGLGYEKPATGEDPLDFQVARARDYIVFVTGRPLDATMPEELVTTAQEAVQRRTEQLVIKSQEDEAETAGDIDMVQSFSAGSYSETRVNSERATKFAGKPLNPWPHLNNLLELLMTEEKREYWQEVLAGIHRPYTSVSEVDWHEGDILDRIDPWAFGA